MKPRVTRVPSLEVAGSADGATARRVVRAYHERTKHHINAFALGPETLDWESQPAPFRHFDGAPAMALPRLTDDEELARSVQRSFAAILDTRPPRLPSLASVGALLHLSLGITAWKTFGPDRWAVRANPSSGNLHPVEAYLLVRGLPGLAPGVYHYRPDAHALECRARFAAVRESSPILGVALSTVMWRQAWKYGERAFRYCQLDTGHAIAALTYAGAVLGWRLSEQSHVGTATLAAALGLDRMQDFPARRRPDTEREEAELLLAVGWGGGAPRPVDPRELREMAASAEWSGVASTIDAHPMYRWPILEEVAAATRVADGQAAQPRSGGHDLPGASVPAASPIRAAAHVILGRRSAQRFDARVQMPADDFFGLLRAVMPDPLARWRLPAAGHAVDLVLLVHRVIGLEAGVYVLSRPTSGSASLATSLSAHFELQPVAAAPPDLDLRLVAAVEARALARIARSLHCNQDIAAQACFALGMVAELDEVIERSPGGYRALHREAGLLGQVLYLESELRGLRGTGIGCFFDDVLHELLKLPDTRFQTLYHFAVGKPIDDPRIETTTCHPRSSMAHESGKEQ